MTDLRTAAQQALEALEQSETFVPYEGFGMAHRDAERKHQAAITALKAALAEPVQEPDAGGCDGSRGALCIHQDPNECKPERDCPAFSAPPQRSAEPVQEPVAWQWLDTAHFRKKIPADATPAHWRPLYTVPPQRKPLTDEEIWRTYKNLWMFHPAEEPRLAGDVLKFARTIERAHNIT